MRVIELQLIMSLLLNIYIFIAFAFDDSDILEVLQFPMKIIYPSCDLGRDIEGKIGLLKHFSKLLFFFRLDATPKL